MSGPGKEALQEGWKLIMDHTLRPDALDLEEPGPTSLFLGAQHEPFEFSKPDGTRIRGISYNMEDYLQSCVDRYVELATPILGKAPNMTYVPTPFLVEDHKYSPAGRPTDHCPTCGHSPKGQAPAAAAAE